MNREHRLTFCKVCKNRSMDSKRGIVCVLTDDYAQFNETCDDFVGDEYKVRKLLENQEEIKFNSGSHTHVNTHSNSASGISTWEVIKIIAGVIGIILSIAKMAN